MGATGWSRPSPRAVWRAIAIYLEQAYDGPRDSANASLPVPVGTPSAVRARLETLRSTPDDAFYDSAVFEVGTTAPACPPGAPAMPGAAGGGNRTGTFTAAPGAAAPTSPRDNRDGPARYALRLGNRHYPHMKLVIDRAPDGRSYLLRADTHDAHCQPRPGSRESASFAELARQNRAVAEAIEARWEAVGLPTFKKFLRDDLERRKAAAPDQPEPPRPTGARPEPKKPGS
jgi:hypothetical protein